MFSKKFIAVLFLLTILIYFSLHRSIDENFQSEEINQVEDITVTSNEETNESSEVKISKENDDENTTSQESNESPEIAIEEDQEVSQEDESLESNEIQESNESSVIEIPAKLDVWQHIDDENLVFSAYFEDRQQFLSIYYESFRSIPYKNFSREL